MAKDILSKMWEDPTKGTTKAVTISPYSISNASNKPITLEDDEIEENIFPVAMIIKRPHDIDVFFIRKITVSSGVKYMFSPIDPNKQLYATYWTSFKEALDWCDLQELAKENVLVVKGEGKFKGILAFIKEVESCISFLNSSSIKGQN